MTYCLSVYFSLILFAAMDPFCDRHQSLRCRHPQVIFDPTASLEERNLSCAAGQLLNQSAATWQSLQTSGTRSIEDQTAFKQTALTTLSPDLADAKLISATSRLLGVSADSIRSGYKHRSDDGLSSTSLHPSKRAARVDAFDKLVVYDFFHPHEPPKSNYPVADMSQLVSINKNHTNRWKGKTHFVAGEHMTLTCAPKIRSATLGQLSREFLESETYSQITSSNPMLSICASTIQGCICPCIKEETITECACPKCSSFDFLTKGVYEGITSVRRQTGCTDAACAAWTASLRNQDMFFDATMCSKVTLDGFDLLSGKKLSIRRFPCCLSSQLDNVSPCVSCGIEKVIPKCECFSTDSLSSTQITWLKQQETLEGKNHDVVTLRFRDYTGTLGEAMELICNDYKNVAFHQWCKSFNRHQFHLDCDYFDGDTEIVLLADFASAMKLGGGVKVVCESDST